MIKNKKQKREIRAIALSQILILVIATIAFSWMIGGNIKEVSASPGASCKTCVINAVYMGYYDSSDTCKANGTVVENCGDKYCQGSSCVTVSGGGDDDADGDGFGVQDMVSAVGAAGGTIEVIKEGKNLAGSLFGKETSTALTSEVFKDTTYATAEQLAAEAAAGEEAFSNSAAANGGVTGADANWQWLMGSNEGGSFTSILQDLSSSVIWAAIAVAVVYGITELIGASERNTQDLMNAAYAGAAIGVTVVVLGGILAAEGSAGPAGWVAGIITLAAAIIYGVVGYQNYAREIVTYRTSMWQPQTGGSECTKCNLLKIGTGENQVSGCSEYICHTYGAACDWVNDETQYETCIETNPGDISAPVITPAKEIYGTPVFTNNKFDYRTSSAGARIIYTGEGGESGQCVPAFSNIRLALTTNENSHCKISLESNNGTAQEAFGLMQDMAEGSSYTKNHTLQLPSTITADGESLAGSGYTLTNGGNYKFYIRCEDVRGNVNSADYALQFCVQSGPDTTPPEITGTNPAENSYIPYNISMIQNFQVYTNEPADCKWDTKEASYAYMNYNFTKCSQSLNDYLVGFNFGCETNLTGFKSGVENKYYVACKDHPEYKGNLTKESKRNAGRPYEVVLIGTNRLLIQEVRINERQNGTIIRGPEELANVRIEITTAAGAEDGNARCLYAQSTADSDSYSLFSNEGSREYINPNTENLYMPAGSYNYLIRCFDVAENTATTMINFSVEVDLSSPKIVRVYKDSESLKIITDEIAECVYSTTSCNYNLEDGVEIDTGDGKEHYVEWNSERDLYVKCIDEYQNRPDDGTCSIIVRPFEVAEVI